MTEDTPLPERFNALEDHQDHPKLKELKARAQLTRASINIKQDGVSERIVDLVNAALDREEMVKVRFVSRKDEKKALSRLLEQATNSLMVLRVGHTATYYRARKKPADETPAAS